MNKQGKVWGYTSEIFKQNNVEVHRIYGDKSTFCSKHKHEHKFNMFFVERGELIIEIWKDYGLVDKTVLEAGQSCTVEPGTFHKFSIEGKEVVAYEFYWIELDSSDIIREDVGGKK